MPKKLKKIEKSGLAAEKKGVAKKSLKGAKNALAKDPKKMKGKK